MMSVVKGREPENEYYGEIIRRAKRFRERAAESLRRSRASRKKPADAGREADASPRRLRPRQQD